MAVRDWQYELQHSSTGKVIDRAMDLEVLIRASWTAIDLTVGLRQDTHYRVVHVPTGAIVAERNRAREWHYPAATP